MKPAAALLLLFLLCPLAGTVPAAAAAPAEGASTVRDLETELATIEKELTSLQQKVDVLLQDLVDPRITSVDIFFGSEVFKDRVPASIEVLLNGRPLVTREFSETDRLILLKGGTLEIHSGILDARQQTLTFRCTIPALPGQGGGDLAAATFALDPVRAAKNFIEVGLARGADPRVAPFVLSAKTWSRE